jgi:hypothetical protein
VLDAITFEKRGIPAAAIITEPFILTAAAIAELAGLPGYPTAVIPHPVGSLTPGEVHARAEAIAPRVAELLLGVSLRGAPLADHPPRPGSP